MRSRRILVTGATGFIGSWVLMYWRNQYPEDLVFATDINLKPLDFKADTYFQADLRDPEAIEQVVAECRPNNVVHLAGLVGKASFKEHLSANVTATANLFEALRKCITGKDLRVVQASSAAIYGKLFPEDLPVKETRLAKPVSLYGLSKLFQQHLGTYAWLRYGIHVTTACIFNIIGAGQSDNLVPMTIIKQLVAIKKLGKPYFKIGDTTTRRDFIDVRDIVYALEALLRSGNPGEHYNVGSGKDVSIQSIIEELISIANINARIEIDPKRIRQTDVPIVRADIEKIQKDTGWSPKYTIKESLETAWQYSLI
jgi:GDP-4-dehydro-6-deoxy-D-mannose reductase